MTLCLWFLIGSLCLNFAFIVFFAWAMDKIYSPNVQDHGYPCEPTFHAMGIEYPRFRTNSTSPQDKKILLGKLFSHSNDTGWKNG